MKVIIRPRAERSIRAVAAYIRSKGYPDTAARFLNRMETFAMTLAGFPDKYPVCRFPHLAKRGFHCEVFERDHIFVYRREGDAVIIHNVLNVKRLRK